jgi:DNA-directed RNA polymerase subunit RPC12/RpoP
MTNTRQKELKCSECGKIQAWKTCTNCQVKYIIKNRV